MGCDSALPDLLSPVARKEHAAIGGEGATVLARAFYGCQEERLRHLRGYGWRKARRGAVTGGER
jgi:hypothetical protein